ncbi:MAG TPA: RNA 2',3'-cyclic phosphodiesterase [Acidimicrobiales bacterium]|nr:RNA 2',3'-cyclic phosphodiesterase [Acidimicrobiales bacterium]
MRLFVAVWPSADVVDVLTGLHRPEVAGVRWTTREQWHVTLRFMGQVADADVDAATDAFGHIDASGVGSVSAEMGPATACFGRGILQVPVEGLDELARVTVEATAAVGQPPDDRPFHGHVTLARARGRKGKGDVRPLRGTPLAARWKVAELTLVASTPHRDGARYEVVSSLPLA